MPSSHKLAILAGQKRHHARNIIRAAKPPQRSIALHLFEGLFTPPVLEARRVDNRRMNRVDTDAVLPQLLCCSECDTAQSEFGAGVGYQARVATQTGDARAKNDRAAVVLFAEGDGDMLDAEESFLRFHQQRYCGSK
jgi:hypothetical protein